jgi:signal transduction histidine kinase
MSLRSQGPACRRCLLAVAMAGAAFGLAQAVGAAQLQKQVLVLHSTRRDANVSIVVDRELPRALEEGLRQNIDYYSEYIDRPRVSNAQYQAAFRDFLRLKYAGHGFDVVLAMDDEALAFVGAYRKELFPDAPVVFYSRRPGVRRLANSTGVVTPLNFSGTLTLATQLQPDIRQVFVVSGAAVGDQEYKRIARSQLQPFESRFTVTYASELPARELEAQLARLPARSIVYYLVVAQDGAGENFHPLDFVDRVVAAANAPTYCWVDSTMGHGIVGGSLLNQQARVESLAGPTLRVLRGERADSIPMKTVDFNVPQVDWRQLRRWGISEARVPAGTLVLFRVPSAWDRYKVYVLGAAALLLAQSALIAGLLVQRARRRQAEARLRASEGQLRTSYERIRDLGRRLLGAQEAERSRLARELHDDIRQQMTILAIDLEMLSRCDQDSLPDAARIATQALDRADAVAASLRDLSHRLHPANLRLIGLVVALEGLQREFSRETMVVTFTHVDVPAVLPHDLMLCLYRIAQEALQNSAKHGGARAVSIRLIRSASGLALTVADDGVGFDVDVVHQGLGLISMGERVEEMGGSLQIRSSPGHGTIVEASVPLRHSVATAEAV